MEPRQRLTFAAIAAVIAVVAVVLLVASGGSDDSNGTASSQNPTTDTGSETTPAPTQDSGGAEAEPTATATAKPKPRVTVVRVRNAEPVGGVKEIEVKQGERIRFRVKSDVADEVHFHGYDVSEDVAPGQDANFDVKATITGIFEAELEDRGTQIASIRVDP
jgi:hypothetical protein